MLKQTTRCTYYNNYSVSSETVTVFYFFHQKKKRNIYFVLFNIFIAFVDLLFVSCSGSQELFSRITSKHHLVMAKKERFMKKYGPWIKINDSSCKFLSLLCAFFTVRTSSFNDNDDGYKRCFLIQCCCVLISSNVK